VQEHWSFHYLAQMQMMHWPHSSTPCFHYCLYYRRMMHLHHYLRTRLTQAAFTFPSSLKMKSRAHEALMVTEKILRLPSVIRQQHLIRTPQLTS
jgi:hypothetical protein